MKLVWFSIGLSESCNRIVVVEFEFVILNKAGRALRDRRREGSAFPAFDPVNKSRFVADQHKAQALAPPAEDRQLTTNN